MHLFACFAKLSAVNDPVEIEQPKPFCDPSLRSIEGLCKSTFFGTILTIETLKGFTEQKLCRRVER